MPNVAALLEAVDRYWLAGRRVLTLDATGDRVQTPVPRSWDAIRDDGAAEVVVVSGSSMSGSDPRGTLGKIRDRLILEGVLAFGPAGTDPATVHDHLSDAGFRMIEWSLEGAELVVARRSG